MLEYYQPAFIHFHRALEEEGNDPFRAHSKRSTFWKLVPPGKYRPTEGAELVGAYLCVLEQELQAIIGKHCIAYWLHAYRRLAPGPVGRDDRPVTVGHTRAILESAFQKYARREPCSGVALSDEVGVQELFRGLYLQPDFRWFKAILTSKHRRELVLTNFGLDELKEIYDVERLAYEVWRSGSLLRCLGKGAPLIVGSSSEMVEDGRSRELSTLLEVFDNRMASESAHAASTRTGTVFADDNESMMRDGFIVIPHYNLGEVTTKDVRRIFRKIGGLQLGNDIKPNFIWTPFNLGGYLHAHEALGEAFSQEYGITLQEVAATLAALYWRAWMIWRKYPGRILHYWQRAYEGPHRRDFVTNEVRSLLPVAVKYLSLRLTPEDVHVERVIDFLALNEEARQSITVPYGGPHAVFLPYGGDRLFIDYAWIARRLFDLFQGLTIPDQNFKGSALEKLVRNTPSALPTRACVALDGTKRQIDAAFSMGAVLLIVECKANGLSRGVDSGQPRALQYRKDIVDNALSEADTKGRWLADRPTGANYDILKHKAVLPIAVTPFVEFIPSLAPKYWITRSTPRVLCPSELIQLLLDKEAQAYCIKSPNAIAVHKLAPGGGTSGDTQSI